MYSQDAWQPGCSQYSKLQQAPCTRCQPSPKPGYRLQVQVKALRLAQLVPATQQVPAASWQGASLPHRLMPPQELPSGSTGRSHAAPDAVLPTGRASEGRFLLAGGGLRRKG